MTSVFRRTNLKMFELANNAYRNSSVTFYEVSPETGASTETLATLYQSYAGADTHPNPITLGSAGRFQGSVYIDVPVIGSVTESEVGNHDTGIIFPQGGTSRGDWDALTVYTPGDIVRDGANGANSGSFYIAAVAHTSAVWASDLDAGKFELFIDVSDISGAVADAESASLLATSKAAEALASADDASASASAASGSSSDAAGFSALAEDFSDLAEDWATTQGATVPGGGGEYAAKEYAIGTLNAHGGSAKGWAVTAEDSTVPGGAGEYSALHHAAKAADSAAAALAAASGAQLYDLGTLAGTASAYTATSGASLSSLTGGEKFRFKPNLRNNSSATLNIDTVGAKALHDASGKAIRASSLLAGLTYEAIYDAGRNAIQLTTPMSVVALSDGTYRVAISASGLASDLSLVLGAYSSGSIATTAGFETFTNKTYSGYLKGLAGHRPVAVKTADYTILDDEQGYLVYLFGAAADREFTLSAEATNTWDADSEFEVGNMDSHTLTITAAAGVTVNGVTAGSITLPQFKGGSFKRLGADNWWYVGFNEDGWA
jgi:hypothetical protein